MFQLQRWNVYLVWFSYCKQEHNSVNNMSHSVLLWPAKERRKIKYKKTRAKSRDSEKYTQLSKEDNNHLSS